MGMPSGPLVKEARTQRRIGSAVADQPSWYIKMKNQPFFRKLRNASAGIHFAWSAEQSFRTEVFLGIGTLVAFAILRPAAVWWALIVLCITLVLVAELANSAIEMLADHLHPDLHPIVGRVKDMLAGMVLVMSCGAAVVGVIALFDTLMRS